MKSYKFKINDKQYEVEILDMDDNTAKVNVNGETYQVEVDRQLKSSKTPILVRSVAVPATDAASANPRTASPAAPKGSGVIKSPLPGTIIDVFVKVGDKVSIGQKLICLEAMKMENNINSDQEGTVNSIQVKKGEAVLEGDLLIKIG
jgi:glutaconyl-CoA/methylmalonyl-CoA decarboxylase subunit gamma